MSQAEYPDSLRRLHEQVGQALGKAKQLERISPTHSDKLTIGIVCGEACGGSGQYFVPPVLRCLQAVGIRLHCYCSHPKARRRLSAWRSCFDSWANCANKSADEICSRIRKDRVQILLDISGHLPYARIDVIARKPAPIIISLPRYPATTGVPAVEYRLTDRWADPPGETESHYTEKLVYMPNGYLAYQAPDCAPSVSTLPALRNGYITFGFFQSPLKLNEGVLDALAGTLRAVPDSRLLVHYSIYDFDRPGQRAREWIADALRERGVERERVLFRGPLALPDHLALLAETDIGLDSFPYSGQTTTCESLWMGVPVVTLTQDRFASRVSAAILHRSGYGDWVAASIPEYITIAAGLAKDLKSLAKTRAALRSRFASSSICNPALIAADMAEIFHRLWQDWKNKQAKTE